MPAGSDAARATELLETLPETDNSAVVLFEATSGQLQPATVRELGDLSKQLKGQITVADDATAALTVVPLKTTAEADQILEIKALRADLAEQTPQGVKAGVTGPAAVATDIDAVFDNANTQLLAATALVVALLLIVTYRSPVLWVIPLVVIGVADRLASVVATQLMAALDVAFDDSTTAILSILVFGAGTDYALLLISRYRTELGLHESRYEAMAVALRRTAEAVLTSAATVVLGVLTLVLSLTPSTRALGVASAIGIAVASAFVLIVLPAALVCFGRWVFWPRVPRHDQPENAQTVWGRVARLVARRPRTIVAASLALVAIASTGVFGIKLGLDTGEAFKVKPEAVSAAERLGQSFPAGTSDPVQILTKDDAETIAQKARVSAGSSRCRSLSRPTVWP